MSNELPYIVEPNRITSTGAETLDAIGLLFVVASDELRMEARTGPTTDREITVEYDQIRAIDLVEGVTPDLEIETRRSEYVVTGIADSLRRARRIADAVSRQAGLRADAGGYNNPADQPTTSQQAPANSGRQSDQQPSMLELNGGSPEYPQRVQPSETFSCPTCDKTVEVPANLPNQSVEVNCPGCDLVLGQVDADRELVVIDPEH